MGIRLLIKTSILKKVQKDALPCALIVHINYIYKQRDTKLQSGGKHLKNKKESHCIVLEGLISSLDVRDITLILGLREAKAAR